MALPLSRSTWVLIGMAALALWTGAAFFTGRATKKCPQILVPLQAVKGPETKPLVPDTVRQRVMARDTLTKWDTLQLTDTLYEDQETPGVVYRQTFGNRWPHSGDSAIVFGSDSITLVPFGFVPQIAPVEAERASGGSSRPFLEAGAILSFGGEHQLFATIPNFLQDKRVFYWPKRIGVAYQPRGGKFGATFSWAVF